MLDLLEVPLQQTGVSYVRLDGSMSSQQREVALARFREDREVSMVWPLESMCNCWVEQVSVFLVSLKAAGLGLNLVSASLVYLIDPWWNPAVEDQAINRVHRLGQSQPVTIKRLIALETVEVDMVELQVRMCTGYDSSILFMMFHKWVYDNTASVTRKRKRRLPVTRSQQAERWGKQTSSALRT